MTSSNPHETAGTILLVGASRGLGHAMAEKFMKKGWSVVGTVRGTHRTLLHDLADAYGDRLEIEQLDVTQADEIAALHDRLSGRRFDILFVNAGTANADRAENLVDASTEEFNRVMLTNVLGPLRVIDGLQDLVVPTGTIGVMSSGQGSIANNMKGGHDLYRASKAALNQCMRSYAARHAGEPRALLLVAPGWIRTALGGPDAPFGIDEAVPEIVSMLLAQQGKPGLRYLDRYGRAVPW